MPIPGHGLTGPTGSYTPAYKHTIYKYTNQREHTNGQEEEDEKQGTKTRWPTLTTTVEITLLTRVHVK